MSERRVRRGGGALQGLGTQTLVAESNECVLDVLERAYDGVLVAQQRFLLGPPGDLVDAPPPSPVEDRHRQQTRDVAEACGAEIDAVHVHALPSEQRADKQSRE